MVLLALEHVFGVRIRLVSMMPEADCAGRISRDVGFDPPFPSTRAVAAAVAFQPDWKAHVWTLRA